MELFFWIFVAFVILVFLLLFAGLLRVREYEDDLYQKIYEQQSKISDHKERLDAHYQNIVTLRKQHDQLTERVEDQCKSAHEDVNVRRQQYADLRSQGMSVLDAGKAIGVAPTTARRYEKWAKDNHKIAQGS